MNRTLTNARRALSREWQRLPDLNRAAGFGPNNGARGFADLAWLGMAEVRRDPVTRHGIAAGEHTFYRLAPHS